MRFISKKVSVMAPLARYLHGIGLIKRFSVLHTAKMQVRRNCCCWISILQTWSLWLITYKQLSPTWLMAFDFSLNTTLPLIKTSCFSVWYLTLAAQVYEELEAGGAFDDGNIARNNLFLSVHDAVLFAQQTTGEQQVPPKVGHAVWNNLIIQILFTTSHTNTCCSKVPRLGVYGEIKTGREARFKLHVTNSSLGVAFVRLSASTRVNRNITKVSETHYTPQQTEQYVTPRSGCTLHSVGLSFPSCTAE